MVSLNTNTCLRIADCLLIIQSFNHKCCILLGPSGEGIVDVVPTGTELEPQVKSGSWAGCTRSQ